MFYLYQLSDFFAWKQKKTLIYGTACVCIFGSGYNLHTNISYNYNNGICNKNNS